MPPLPGLFSALGLLVSGVEHHDVRSCQLSGDGLGAEALGRICTELRREMLQRFEAEGYGADQVEMLFSADMRFQGQTSRIRVPLEAENVTSKAVKELCAAFEDEHERLYGHRSDPDNPIDVVAVRLVGRAGLRGLEGSLKAAELAGRDHGSRQAYFDGEKVDAPISPRSAIVRYRGRSTAYRRVRLHHRRAAGHARASGRARQPRHGADTWLRSIPSRGRS